jgi:hypothetical protein
MLDRGDVLQYTRRFMQQALRELEQMVSNYRLMHM